MLHGEDKGVNAEHSHHKGKMPSIYLMLYQMMDFH